MIALKTHCYFYQVLLRMKMCDVHFCDFVMWRNVELAINRIKCDDNFLEKAIDKTTTFLKYCILLEIVGKWFTCPLPTSTELQSQPSSSNSSLATSDTNAETVNDTWYYCRKQESGKIIMCERDNCRIVYNITLNV